jgi:hypothetical protein
MSKEVILDAIKNGGVWYDWDKLNDMNKIPDDLSVIQRTCVTFGTSIIQMGGNVYPLVLTGIITEERGDKLVEVLQSTIESDDFKGRPSQLGEAIYNFFTEDERDKAVDFTRKTLADAE